MLDKVRRTIAKYGLITPKSTIIVGFSGGIDSVCLLHILKSLTEYELDLWALYVNHQLRPAENQKEIELLNRLGSEWNVHTRQVSINLPEMLRQKQQSLQLLARKERYQAFKNFQQEIGADRIALAHHQDDQAETILYRIIRGTGLDGLAGIPIIRDNLYIRPLLEVSRAEITQYAVDNHLEWIEDSSNRKLIYCRNRIRQKLLPELETIYNPRIKQGLLRLGEFAREQVDFMEQLVADCSEELIQTAEHTVRIKLKPFLELHPFMQYQILKKAAAAVEPGYRLESRQLDQIREKVNREKNYFKSMHIYKGIEVMVSEDWIVFRHPYPTPKTGQSSFALQAPGVTAISELNLEVAINPALPPGEWNRVNRTEVYVDAGKINLPLKIRFWKTGDCFWPLGAPGRQKLHDYYINAKIPRQQRHKIPLLVDRDDQIIWIMGYRLDNGFKITSQTREVWHISQERLSKTDIVKKLIDN